MKKTILVLIALVLFVPGNVFAANGTPFQELQKQIDQLKIQLENIQLIPGPPGAGAIKVYDANNQFLGIYAGLLPGLGPLMPGIFIPDLKLFVYIILDPANAEYGQIPKGGYITSTSQEGIFVQARDKLFRTCDDKYFYGIEDPINIGNATSIFFGCSIFPVGSTKGFKTEEIQVTDFPFTLPIAMPLRYE
jgi:hypothetical protein